MPSYIIGPACPPGTQSRKNQIEEDISAEGEEKKKGARFQEEDEDQVRAEDHQTPQGQRPVPPHGLSRHASREAPYREGVEVGRYQDHPEKGPKGHGKVLDRMGRRESDRRQGDISRDRDIKGVSIGRIAQSGKEAGAWLHNGCQRSPEARKHLSGRVQAGRGRRRIPIIGK